MENRATQETFQSLKNMKRRVHRNDKKNIPWDFEKCPGSLCFPLLIITIIAKIRTNDKSNNKNNSNYQNSNNKKKKTKSSPYVQKSLSSKRTSPVKVQMLNMLVIKLLDTFFNIKPKWCCSLKCASLVVFPLKWIRWVSFIYKG